MIVLERHSDPDVELFASESDAVDRAQAIVEEYTHPDYPDDVNEELTEPMRRAGWLYYGSWSGEGESVFVVEKEVQ